MDSIPEGPLTPERFDEMCRDIAADERRHPTIFFPQIVWGKDWRSKLAEFESSLGAHGGSSDKAKANAEP